MKLSTHKFAGIKFIDFHTHRQAVSPDALSIVSIELADLQNLALENIDNSLFSVGLHPWRLPDNTDRIKDDLKKLAKALQISEVIALGEVGLDRLWGPDMEVQKAYLAGCLKLAEELTKPVIIHCVRSYPEFISLKKLIAPKLNTLVHGYNNNVQILEELLKHGSYVSFGSVALERDDICSYIRRKPEVLNRICLETDDSETGIGSVYNCAAQVFEMDIEKLSRLMKNNFISFFQVENHA